MTNIYDLHTKAFSHVSAYVILKDGERVATIALKYPKDGAGRLYAYVHYIGLEMVRDYAGGYGYDKRSAAITRATAKIKPYRPSGLDGEPLAPWQVNIKKKLMRPSPSSKMPYPISAEKIGLMLCAMRVLPCCRRCNS